MIVGTRTETIRKEWLDVAKGILILFVILGHTPPHKPLLLSWIGCFYMSAFFVLSGVVMRERLRFPLYKHVGNRARQLLGPYLLFSVAWIMFSWVKSLVTLCNYSVPHAIISIFLPYSGRVDGSVYNFWFLPCMFLAQLAVCMCLYIPGRKKALGVLLAIGYFVCGMMIENGSLLLCSAMAIVFIGIGYFIRRLFDCSISFFFSLLALLLYVVTSYGNVAMLGNVIDFSSACYGNVPLFILSSLGGTVFVCKISQWLHAIRPLQFIGRNSLTYYLVHYFFISIFGFLIEDTVVVAIGTLLCTSIVVLIYNKVGVNNLFTDVFKS